MLALLAPTLAHLKLTKNYLHTTRVFDGGATGQLLRQIATIKTKCDLVTLHS